MKTSLVILVLVSVALAAASAAIAAAWSGTTPWSKQRLTYEVKTLKIRLADTNRNVQNLSYQHTTRELQILKCVRAPEGQEQACVDALGKFGVTDSELGAILP
jgi:hypothetical protein